MATQKPEQTRRPVGTMELLVTIFVCLLVSHLAISTYFPSVAVNAVGLVLVTLIIGRVILIKGDVFAGLMILFVCSQFKFANNQGGLFNLVAFLLLVIYLVVKPSRREIPRPTDTPVGALLIILMASDVMGLILRNPLSMDVIVLQGVAFAGIMLAFYVAASLRLTEGRLRQLVIVISVMAAYNFAVSLNQHYGVLWLSTPLLGLNRELFYATSNAYGTFGSASSNGQYAMMLIALLLPMLAASVSTAVLRLRPIYFVPAIMMCGLTLILANMRAAAIEAVVVVLVYTVMFSVMYRRSFRNARYVNMASVAAIVVIVTAGIWFGLQNLEADFRGVQTLSVENIESGRALNRFGPWQYGWERLQSENWWIGFGYGTDASNLIAWGGKIQSAGVILGGGHLHNLYLALPMHFGWLGAVAYALLFLVVVFRLSGAIRKYPFDNLMVVTCLGFVVSLAMFLVDEFKSGNAVQMINFSMVVWIWLGLALAAHRTLKYEVALARVRRAQRGAEPGSAEPEGTEASEKPPPEKAGPVFGHAGRRA